jgi:hypothetical protein
MSTRFVQQWPSGGLLSVSVAVWVGDPISPYLDPPITACVLHSANCSADILVESSDIDFPGANDFDYLAKT